MRSQDWGCTLPQRQKEIGWRQVLFRKLVGSWEKDTKAVGTASLPFVLAPVGLLTVPLASFSRSWRKGHEHRGDTGLMLSSLWSKGGNCLPTDLLIFEPWSHVFCYLQWKAILMTQEGYKRGEKQKLELNLSLTHIGSTGGAWWLACNVYSQNVCCLQLIRRSQTGHTPCYSLHLFFYCRAILLCSHPRETCITTSIIMAFYYQDLKSYGWSPAVLNRAAFCQRDFT